MNKFYASWRIAGNFKAKKLWDIEFLKKNTSNVAFEKYTHYSAYISCNNQIFNIKMF